ncbi:MAG: Asp-tRNA(Asn)/Glu-tRNA(Gln) amidotransferase subunit GatC [Chloroflexi bacterium]|nr:Asp-tRNA(Asn)/Glu-tRNA(Gln) amidotransferase subunit GatC [Chloroflexota bacterium]
MKLNRQEVEYVAYLARLGLSEDEIERFREQLSKILENFEILSQVDTSAILPTAHVLPLQNVLREDQPQPSFPQRDILANAPSAEDAFFKTKAILE